MTLRNGVAWLSSSSAEITRARAVLDALRKPGVIDELGFLMLNGAFAERFYPGVTTIMTRARYLIFVPAVYKYLEQSRKARGKDVDRISRDLQFDLRNALAKNESSFIGKESGRNLVRTPSEVYWTALGALGLATQRISEASYQRHLSEGKFGPSGYKDDDDAAHDEEAESLWTDEINLSHVLASGVFSDATDFRLRKTEAKYLANRYALLRPDGNDSLVTRMVALGREHGASSLEDIEYPWNVPGVPSSVAGMLEHARRLSLFARGTTLHYYRLLLEKKREDASSLDEAFGKWLDYARADLHSWDVPAFFRLMTLWGAGRGARDKEFITSWIDRTRTHRSAQALLSDQAARTILSRREDCVRPGKQRLRVKHQLEAWTPPNRFAVSFYYMDYRHHVGRQIATDIADGLTRGAA